VRAAAVAALEHGDRVGMPLAIVFVSDAALARLHARWLGDPSPTDVMAFDLGTDGAGPAGEIYVSVERARAEARRRRIRPERELTLYVVHGCLHLCGYDDHDPRERGRMRRAEAVVLGKLGFRPQRRQGDGSRSAD